MFDPIPFVTLEDKEMTLFVYQMGNGHPGRVSQFPEVTELHMDVQS